RPEKYRLQYQRRDVGDRDVRRRCGGEFRRVLRAAAALSVARARRARGSHRHRRRDDLGRRSHRPVDVHQCRRAPRLHSGSHRQHGVSGQRHPGRLGARRIPGAGGFGIARVARLSVDRPRLRTGNTGRCAPCAGDLALNRALIKNRGRGKAAVDYLKQPHMRKLSITFACVAASLIAGPAAAQWKPEKNIEIIVGTGPGGGQDKTARTVQHLLTDKRFIEAPVTVVNKPGGGGAVGWAYLNQHAGDPHYAVIGTTTLLTSQIIGRSPVGFTDITPLAMLLSESVALSVRQESPLVTGKDLVERLKKDASSVSASIGS